MGQKPKLTADQWKEIELRVVNGEGYRALAREYGVSDAAIRQRVSSRVKEIKSLAEQMVSTETRLSALPVASQIATQNLAAKYRAITDNMLIAAHNSSISAAALSERAMIENQKVLNDDVDSLKRGAALQRMANEAMVIPMGLMTANKESVKKANEEKDITPETIPTNPIAASRAYQRLINNGAA